MSQPQTFSGGCACGAIRYRASGTPVMVAYCYCDGCRRSSGSVVSVLAGFARADFELLQGEPADFEATEAATRSFCRDCGSPLFYTNRNFPENQYIQIGSLDDPEQLPPDRHTWLSDRISWHEVHDNLMQFDKLSNDGLPDNTPPYQPAAGSKPG